jgi:hypothetical protein
MLTTYRIWLGKTSYVTSMAANVTYEMALAYFKGQHICISGLAEPERFAICKGVSRLA